MPPAESTAPGCKPPAAAAAEAGAAAGGLGLERRRRRAAGEASRPRGGVGAAPGDSCT